MKRTALYIIMSVLCLATRAQVTYVVAVGIADYAYIGDLRSTERDVAMFCEVMNRHTTHVSTLLGRRATHGIMLSELENVFAKAKAEDAVIFYFCGHGFPGGFCCYDTKDERSGLTYTEMQRVFKKCKAKRKMVFADACFSGGMRINGNNGASSTARSGDVMFFLSSRTGEISIERGQNGVYTQNLVRGLRGGADANRDRIITAKELYDFVHEGVTRASNQKQHPVMWGKFNNTMTILNWNK